MRKQILWIPFFLLLLALSGCQTQQKQQDISLPEPAAAEALSEPAQEGPTQVPEPASEPELPENELPQERKQALHDRLFYASVCTCLMEDSARWHLRDLGIEADAPDEGFSGAMDAFAQALSAYPEGPFMNDAFWLIDTAYHGLELQFWKYDENGHPGKLSCAAAFYWEPGMEQADLLGEDLLFYTLDWASCTKDASDEERTRIQEQYERLLPDFSSGTGWRASLAPDGTLALTVLDPETGASIYYMYDTMHGTMIFHDEDLPAVQNDAVFRALAGAAFDESVISPEGQTLLRGFLASALCSGDFLPWDGPRPVFSFDDMRLAYDLGNAFSLLLSELRTDKAAGNEFLASGPWTLFCDGGAAFHLAGETGQEIARSAPLP